MGRLLSSRVLPALLSFAVRQVLRETGANDLQQVAKQLQHDQAFAEEYACKHLRGQAHADLCTLQEAVNQGVFLSKRLLQAKMRLEVGVIADELQAQAASRQQT